MRLLWRLISGLLRLIWRTLRTVWITVIVLVLLVSMAVNVAVFSTGAIATAVAAAVEFVTGTKTVLSLLKGKTAEAVTWERKATATVLKLEKELAARAAVEADLATAKKLASKWEGTAIGKALALEKEKAARAVAVRESVALRRASRVVYEGVEMTAQEAITRATSKIKMRTVKLATADLSATAAQALPWIGVAAVVAATGYDLKMSCDTMKDMHTIELAVNPGQVDDPNMGYVCGLRVPTEEEVWVAVKASPGAAWESAKRVLDNLPAIPEMPEPDINWKFWK